MKRTLTTVAGAALVMALSTVLGAQWPQHPTPGVPRLPDGTVDMNAPTPRMADGKPDFTGVWGGGFGGGGGGRGRGGRGGGRGAEAPPPDPNVPPNANFGNIGRGFPNGLPYRPWAKELRDKRSAENSMNNPDAHCLPMGFMQFHTHPQPNKIVHTKDVMMIVYEANYGLRTIYLDGRELPPQGEPQPWWYGYSVGRWDGDELVVTTNNLRGAPSTPEEASPLSTEKDGWLDVGGTPYSDAVVFTERFRRPNFGTLQIDVTIDDPKAYTEPWTVRVNQRFRADEELIEFICNENERSSQHFQ